MKSQMKNFLTSDEFNRYDATKDRSPRFRAVVIFLLLLFSSVLIYILIVRTDASEAANQALPKPSATTSK